MRRCNGVRRTPNTIPEMPNSTSVHRIQPVRSSGNPPCIAARTPLAMMTRTPGMVNSRSLRSTPSIACAMSRASPVRSACLCQNRPVTMLPMNRITARMWTSFSQRYIASAPDRRDLFRDDAEHGRADEVQDCRVDDPPVPDVVGEIEHATVTERADEREQRGDHAELQA